ncbi:hypothetical protein DFH06DRAFT_752209 [Mycena polygramma]|nr:hypothetical protein DFH06DRAFT_752209 [Mycena polygramma]
MAPASQSPRASLSFSMTEPNFSQYTKNRLHQASGNYCSVCLTRQTPTGSQCAHLYPKADRGQDMVDAAKSLGLLDPDPEFEYNRDDFDNGTIQCPTCHQGYFTPGYLAFSPAIQLLEWIKEQLDALKHANAHSVWKIFHFLATEEGPYFDRFYQLYSLIPRFDPKRPPPAGWYGLPCHLPSICIVGEDGKFASVEPRRTQRIGQDVQRFRIFDVQDNIQRNAKGLHHVRPGLIYLLPPRMKQKRPTNFWRIRVPCHVMLYVFIDAIKMFKFDHAFPEVALAMKICERLEAIRRNSGQTWLGNRRALKIPVSTDGSTPKHHQDCRHPMKHNSKKYCSLCYTLIPSNFPPMDPLPLNFVSPAHDTKPSRPARRPSTTPTRPLLPPSRVSNAAAAYPTPFSPPSPGGESDEGYFWGASTPDDSSRPIIPLSTPF